MLTLKRQLEHAVRCLQWCEQHQPHPDAAVFALPWPRDYLGDFGLAEVNEMGQPDDSLATLAHAPSPILQAGDVILVQTHGFNLPPDDEGRTP